MPKRTLEERFWAKVIKAGPDECWLWTGAPDKNGYGRLWVSQGQAGNITFRAHRYSFEIHNGGATGNLFVCHTCDTPSCVNPAHLFLGTPQDNMTDKTKKGRGGDLKGSNNGAAKLDNDKVRAIRAMRGTGTLKEIGARFGVDGSTVGYILRGERWTFLLNGEE